MNRAKALTGSASPLGRGFATWEHRGTNKAKMLEIHFPADTVDMTILFCSPFFVRLCCYPASDESHDVYFAKARGSKSQEHLQPLSNLRVFIGDSPQWLGRPLVKQEWILSEVSGMLSLILRCPPRRQPETWPVWDLSLFGRKTCTSWKSLRYQRSPHISYTSLMNQPIVFVALNWYLLKPTNRQLGHKKRSRRWGSHVPP